MGNNLIKDYNFSSQTFREIDKCSWWVQNAYQSFSNAKQWLNSLDCIADFFEKTEDNKKVLVSKAKNFRNEEINWRGKSGEELNENQREKERQIFSFFSELKSAEELKIKGYEKIKFIEVQNDLKTPDISAEKDGKKFYIEVKGIQKPRNEDEALRSVKGYCSGIKRDFREPLKKKIGDFICDAKAKFESIDKEKKLNAEQRILVLDFEPGLDARLTVDFDADLNKIFEQDFFNNLECAHDMQIWPRKYF